MKKKILSILANKGIQRLKKVCSSLLIFFWLDQLVREGKDDTSSGISACHATDTTYANVNATFDVVCAQHVCTNHLLTRLANFIRIRLDCHRSNLLAPDDCTNARQK
ncbi:uncharacterized protein LOC107269955 [Cephus cinctus]|uniref:Uncharacterized protein LOC107269955 n=1 Tax=Cephus cinctus TaxID=211228 RepID=A0AAJ7W3E6_CEPCN|nr:uncharacterized protein LOC107269955 [Cephus cinctus]